jgi:hypothetical protein
MSDFLPAVRPSCEKHGVMALRKPGTKEQAFCGTWYECTHEHPRCRDSVLLPSPGLLAQLEQAGGAQ